MRKSLKPGQLRVDGEGRTEREEEGKSGGRRTQRNGMIEMGEGQRAQGKKYLKRGSNCGDSKKPDTREILRNTQGFPQLRP